MAARMIDAFEYRSRASDIVFGKIRWSCTTTSSSCMRYRFFKETVRELLLLLPLKASGNNRGLPLSAMLQLLINVSQPTVCRAVEKVTRLIARHLFSKLVHFLESSQFPSVMRDFYEIADFPGVTARYNCTHVRIKAPAAIKRRCFANGKECSQ
ncbi:hypothetical protein HPB49_006836 [Dermacentor silvarum]|uniref:Uncharacterized protein n=1 Tax=Dermacentor silvarum TaxID=543639 RepID=A0ACB8CQP2_DERSI|nr:hypothetical protein HPB49_006836 [Dermacentor silvarum]